jgi:hypothetical protein
VSAADVDAPAASRSGREWSGVVGSIRTRGRPYLILLVVSVAGIAVRQLIGPVIRWTSPVDDENQMRVAAALVSGDWLGAWGSQPIPHATLSKGPGYPLFVAALEPAAVGPRIAAYLIYLVGALFLVLGIRALVGWGWSLGLYTLLAFCPQVMAVAFSRPYRDQLVAALALAAFGSAVYVGRALQDRYWRWPRWVGAVLATLTLAITLGWLAITRNDTIWVVAASALVILCALLPVAGRLWWRGWVRAAVVAAAVVVSVLGLPAAIAAVNSGHYGVRLTDDYSQGTFPDAVRSWEAVVAPGGDPFMLVTRPQREAAYAVSPAAREVRTALEDPKNPWRGWPCGWRPKNAPACEEFGPFFGWAIRDAAYQAGYTTAVRFQEYFGRLSSEIDAACSSGGLTCGPKGVTADLPPVGAWSARTIISDAADLAHGSISFTDVNEGAQEPIPNPNVLHLWEQAMPEVGGLALQLNAGVNPDVIAQAQAVDIARQVYSVLGVLALLATLVGLGSGLLYRHPIGWVALCALAGWAGNIVIVAIVFAATNRSFGGVVPSYTISGQAFLVVGLALGSWVTLVVGGRRLALRRRSARRAAVDR